MSDNLPVFTYHPDPIATGSVTASDAICDCCGKARGFIYTGTVYTEDEVEDVCPWCIADGTAHTKFDASFTDESGIGGYGDWDSVSKAVIETVAYRTPGFASWQEGRWWTHCNDAAEFIGPAGRKELQALGAQAITAIRESAGLPEGREWDTLFSALHKEKGPTAYLFRCRKCGQLGGYQDCT
jgi:uncharacterized protein